MAQVIADRRDVDFVLFEQLAVEMLSDHERYADFNRKTIEMIVSEARNLAVKEIYPTQQEGDSGCTFEDGKVTVPDCYHRPWEMYLEGEWLAMPEDPNYGGQGMPRTVAMAANDYLVGANYGFAMYAGLTHGAALLVEAFGTQEIKDRFLKKMFTGEWTGTMLLTEPEAGSDVGP
jgi:alkylation response protein AidB-like acyl-CoA dehydrogenase